MKYIIIGLGNYGEMLSRRLTDLGHDVIGVDKDKRKVEKMASLLSATICLDSVDSEGLSALPLQKTDSVIVAIGQEFASSIQTVAQLRQLGVKSIIARGLEPLHIGVLETLGVERVVFPEQEAATSLSYSLSLVDFHNAYKIDEEHYIFQFSIPDSLVGNTVEDADFASYNLDIITIKAPFESVNILKQSHVRLKVIDDKPALSSVLEKGDVIVIFGTVHNFDLFIKGLD